MQHRMYGERKMSYPESSYDGADGSLDRDISEATYRLEELNADIADLEDQDMDATDLIEEGEQLRRFLDRYEIIY